MVSSMLTASAAACRMFELDRVMVGLMDCVLRHGFDTNLKSTKESNFLGTLLKTTLKGLFLSVPNKFDSWVED